ncbi:MAG: type II toxin-antitoxin system RelE/ParE family toxin [Chloroflexi bacterium]|nr:type II toxin-antitoxin system RelE/ParE family toxin [Chloroflexota bacterium]
MEPGQAPPFRIQVRPSALKELAALPADVERRVQAAIDRLAMNPIHSGVTKLHGVEDTYRIRVGDYRVIYHVDVRRRVVRIERVAHRRDAYR